MTEPTAQEIPEQANCPGCGAEPSDESLAEHKLSQLGYVHDDIVLECSECESSWTHGVPIGDGDSDLAEDLWCDVCEDQLMRVHRIDATDAIAPNAETILELHLKCPECYYFATAERRPDSTRIALVGYPDITGDVEDADPWAYQPEDV